MPPAIISPSVLASDFGQLTAECKRMLRGGAQWLHMGTLGGALHSCRCPFAECLHSLRCHGWVRLSRNMSCDLSEQLRSPDISSRILPWVIVTIDCRFPSDLDRNPEKRCPCARVCFEGCTRDLHGLSYDGFRTREGADYTSFYRSL